MLRRLVIFLLACVCLCIGVSAHAGTAVPAGVPVLLPGAEPAPPPEDEPAAVVVVVVDAESCQADETGLPCAQQSCAMVNACPAAPERRAAPHWCAPYLEGLQRPPSLCAGFDPS